MTKWRFNPFTGELDDSGAIVGAGAALAYADSAQELGDFLDLNFKSHFNISQPVTLYLDQDAGSDINTGLSSGAAIQSLSKVQQLIHGVYSTTQVTVNVAQSVSAYVVPYGFINLRNVRFLGAQVIEYTRNVVANVSTSDSYGCEFTFDGAQIADDELSGRVLQITNQFSNSRNINVVRNSWNGTRNVLYGAMYNRGFFSDVQSTVTSSADINLLKFPEFQFPSATVISAVVDCNLENIKVTGGNIFVNGGAKQQFLRCEIACTSIVAGLGGASVFILSSAIANIGNATNGVLGSRTNGTLRLGYGNVYVSKNLADPSYMRMKVAENATIEWEGGGIFRGLAGNGIFFDGSNSAPVSAANLKLVFDKQTGTATCAKAFSINPGGTVAGNNIGIPECRGGVTGAYFLTARLGAQVKIASTTSITTATVDNAVSADNGTNPSSRNIDGTKIFGGTPAFDVFNHVTIANANLGKGSTAPAQVVVGNYTGWQYNIGDDSVLCIELPHDVDSAQDISIHLVWAINEAYATNNGEVQWKLDWSAASSHESGGNLTSPAHSGTVSSGDTNIPATAYDVYHTTNLTIAAGNFTALDVIGAKISRIALVGGTDPTADPVVVSAHLEYTSTS